MQILKLEKAQKVCEGQMFPNQLQSANSGLCNDGLRDAACVMDIASHVQESEG